jgi:hypothetical protein
MAGCWASIGKMGKLVKATKAAANAVPDFMKNSSADIIGMF